MEKAAGGQGKGAAAFSSGSAFPASSAISESAGTGKRARRTREQQAVMPAES